jgi:hypothetical protein
MKISCNSTPKSTLNVKMDKEDELLFRKRRHISEQEYIKLCITLLINRGIQLKTTIRFNLTSIWIDIFQTTKQQIQHRIESLVYFLLKCKMVLWHGIWWFFKKLRKESLLHPVILLLKIYTKELIDGNSHGFSCTNSHGSIFQ